MELIFSEIQRCLNSKLYYSALVCALILPDTCASLSSPNGKTDSKKYKEWYSKYVQSSKNNYDSEDCYDFRCSMVHEGSTSRKKSKFSKILFIPPGSSMSSGHNNTIQIGANAVLWIDINIFCLEIVNGGRKWFRGIQQDENFRKNYQKLIKIHPNGYPPYMFGIPVIG